MYISKNNIGSGHRGDTVSVYCDVHHIHELEFEVANAIAASYQVGKIIIFDIWRNKEELKSLRTVCPFISDDAIRAIRDANIRGVTVEIFYYDPKARAELARSLALDTKIGLLAAKDKEKVAKIFKKYGWTL